jgi:hypothetical protein
MVCCVMFHVKHHTCFDTAFYDNDVQGLDLKLNTWNKE